MPLPSDPVSVAIGAQVLACVNDVDRAVTNYVEWADLRGRTVTGAGTGGCAAGGSAVEPPALRVSAV
jgi:hypothetical protein